MMEIILLERIEKLGQIGDVVAVKPGFARNYLIPQKKALRSTKANLAFFETQKAQLVADNLKRKEEAEKMALKVQGLTIIVIRQAGPSGQLYGSVSSKDIAEGVTAEGFTIAARQVVIAHPIKMLGLEDVSIHLHPEVDVQITVNVAKSVDEAKAQAAAFEKESAAEQKAAAPAAAAFVDPGDMPQPDVDLSDAYDLIDDK
jgi:large subunit ribosomal protein L9